jgi:hypothetical protein
MTTNSAFTKTSLILLLAVLIILAGIGTGRLTKKVRAQYVAAPYSITVREWATDGTTTTPVTETFLGRRSDGATVKITKIPSGLGVKDLEFPAENLDMTIIGNVKLVMGLGPRHPREVPPASEVCELYQDMNAKDLGTTQFLGFTVLHRKAEGPAYTEHDLETFVAPALGCAELKSVRYWKTNGVLTGEVSTKEAVKVSAAEPDPSVFFIPPEQQDVSPEGLAMVANPGLSRSTMSARQKQTYDRKNARWSDMKRIREQAQ